MLACFSRGRQRKSNSWRGVLPRPQAPLEQAVRGGVEGCMGRCLVLLPSRLSRFIALRDLSHLSSELFQSARYIARGPSCTTVRILSSGKPKKDVDLSLYRLTF
jgi:hypothetical protein